MKTVTVSYDSHWIFYSDDNSNISDSDMTGKYLFFSTNIDVLKEICNCEIADYGFTLAKVSKKPTGGEYVCCLYWSNDSRRYELLNRYKHRRDIKYRYWKSNEDTYSGKYSKKYLRDIRK